MNYKICKLHFKSGIHVPIQNNDSPCFMADTIFSALCTEALATEDGIEKIIKMVREGKIKISDMMPYTEDDYFIKKPFFKVEADISGDSVEKKKFKKLKYIGINNINQFLNGKLNPDREIEKAKKIGNYDIRTNVKIDRIEQTEPFQIQTYHFNKTSGLYFLIGYESEKEFVYLNMLIEALSYSGIGGKRSRGLGRFEYHIDKVPELLLEKLCNNKASKYISLSLSLPHNDELEKVCETSSYQLIKRSGFVASANYAKSYLKKKDFYCFAAGSVFEVEFRGDIYDVSGKEGNHPVYQYAIPMFMGV